MASREAFDLFHPACRRNVMRDMNRWKYWWFWKIVASDTFHRVCSAQR